MILEGSWTFQYILLFCFTMKWLGICLSIFIQSYATQTGLGSGSVGNHECIITPNVESFRNSQYIWLF